MTQPTPATDAPVASRDAGASAPTRSAPQAVASEHLLQGQKTLDIDHHGVRYRLHATKLGKLILTK